MSQRGIQSAGGSLFNDPGQDGLLHRAFLRGVGYSREEVRRAPVIGIANSGSNFNPCNAGLKALVKHVKAGVREAGGIAIDFPTISISEPFARPTSLLLRNLLSMDTEEMISSLPIDGVVVLAGCDKTVPAMLMGAISANKPTLLVSAGPRPDTCILGDDTFTIDDVWPVCEGRRLGRINDAQWQEVEDELIRAPGTCNVVGTATTMAAIGEVLGFSLPGSTLAPSGSKARQLIARNTGSEIVAAVKRAQEPQGLLTEAHFHNALVAVAALGGSTNAIVHLVAMAGRAGIRITSQDIDEVTRDVPYIVNVRPGGEHPLGALERAGGIQAVLGALSGLLDLETTISTGRPLKDSIRINEPSEANAIASPENPVSDGPALRMLYGNLAPGGALLKTVGTVDPRLRHHRGPAIVFDGIDELNERIDDPTLKVTKDSILVLRGMGVRGSGMPEVGHIPIPAKLAAEGVIDMVRLSDARMSGTSSGTVVLHVTPESAVGGPLSLVRTGDEIELDVDAGAIILHVQEEELARREPVELKMEPARGYRWLHVNTVLQPNEGCDFEFLRHESLRKETPMLETYNEFGSIADYVKV